MVFRVRLTTILSRESISIVIRDASGAVVASASGELASGNVQSTRIGHGGGRD